MSNSSSSSTLSSPVRQSRITATFDALKAQKRTGLITFVTAGDPAPDVTVPLLHALVKAGADVLELGVPFSDPMAEGPVIQRACERALRFNVSMHDVLGMVREFRLTNQTTPVVLMGYANPIEAMGVAAFVDAANAAGVDGTIVVDYPPEECEEMARLMQARQMSPVFLLAPTSTPARIGQVAALSSGFTYYVSLKGVTGAATIDTVEVAARLAEIRQQVSLPIAVGFGIRDAATALEVAKVADAVVIGSQLIAEMESVPAGQPEAAIAAAAAFLAPIRVALDGQGRP